MSNVEDNLKNLMPMYAGGGLIGLGGPWMKAIGAGLGLLGLLRRRRDRKKSDDTTSEDIPDHPFTGQAPVFPGAGYRHGIDNEFNYFPTQEHNQGGLVGYAQGGLIGLPGAGGPRPMGPTGPVTTSTSGVMGPYGKPSPFGGSPMGPYGKPSPFGGSPMGGSSVGRPLSPRGIPVTDSPSVSPFGGKPSPFGGSPPMGNPSVGRPLSPGGGPVTTSTSVQNPSPRMGYAQGGLISLPGAEKALPPQMRQQMQPPQQMGQQPQTANPEDDQSLVRMAMAAIQGKVPNPQQVLQIFVSRFGQQALVDLIARVKGGSGQPMGDGMSDSIPATQDGGPAALSEGEFIVPSDVVSGIGNGSTQAGASQLEQMMAKVRQMRGGSQRQPPAIDPNKMMPV